MLKDLKAFLFRGNIVDLAVAVVIGGAFGAIIKSFVNDIITPLILNPALKAANVQNIADLAWNGVKYGSFLSAVINFLIIGTSMFFVVKAAEKAMPKKVEEKAMPKKVEEKAPAGPTQEELLAEIRDLLKK
ncbi:large conductance mechanosensitive channel protein MscL [Streptococcus suis]|uniref:large conductance mechanosensitive channel protein MscL n=1 Tax=Streptococcus suis TaxID=1307 RepID=UPI00191625CC|nr:large conductance mechanosensitive channel protein MscL [Streptococcus suis]HEM5259242.1 large conductance mechanosensitive channel protein MscL [Streptococcus suis]